MFGMGGSEIIVILIVALLFLGPEKLPSAAKQISKGIRDIKKQSRALQQQIENDETIGGAIRDLKSALRDEPLPAAKPPRKPKPPKELPAPGEPTIHPNLGATDAAGEPEAAGERVEARVAADGGDPVAAEALAEGDAEPVDEARPVLRLPVTAGEADPDVPASTDDDDELAAMIKPAAGTVAKGT